jgi:hypothetical protein
MRTREIVMRASRLRFVLFLFVQFALVVLAPSAFAASQRTFVSTNGVDNPTCSIGAPCRTFGAAVAATSIRGEVIALTSGGYGPVTIGQAVSITAPAGVYVGISVATGDGVTISAGPTDLVTLRGLTINSTGGTNGIHLVSAARILVEDTTIAGFNGANGTGVLVDDAAAAANNVTINRSILRNNRTGFRFDATVAPNRAFDFSDVAISNGVSGIVANGNFSGSVRNSSLMYFTGGAINVSTTAPNQYPYVTLDHCRVELGGAAIGILFTNTVASSGGNISIIETSIKGTPGTLIRLNDTAGGSPTLSVVNSELSNFGQRAIDASSSSTGGDVKVSVAGSKIHTANGDRAISVDVGPTSYGKLQLAHTRMENLDSISVYTKAGAGGFVAAMLDGNTISFNSGGVVADSNSVIALSGNSIFGISTAGLIIQGSGSWMLSPGNNFVSGNGGVDATPSPAPYK